MSKVKGPTEAIITRALNAAITLGLRVSGYEVGENGTVTVHIANEDKDSSRTALDEWKARREAR